MNKQTLGLLLYLTMIISSFGQNISNHNTSQVVHGEKIFVHYNTTFLMPGENQYFKVYCLNNNNDLPSTLSKIAYIELVSNNKESVFKEKIKLENGIGNGYFFIPSDIRSGSYKLIAYTQWMRNNKIDPFFQGDVSIVNPYRVNEEIISEQSDSLHIQKNKIFNSRTKSIHNDIELKVNKKIFRNREKVILNIDHLRNDYPEGNYSLSVRKIDQLLTPQKPTSVNFDSIFSKNKSNLQFGEKINYLPELRGELLSGKVVDNKTNKAVDNLKIALSIPGEDYIFKISNTNNKGVFYFNIDKEYETQDAIFQVIGKDREKYQITMDEPSSLDFDNLDFFDFKITKDLKDLLLKHSIYNQIENSYASVKQDSITKTENNSPFFDSKSTVYFLDDYNRFPTLKETIIEIIPNVYVRRRKGNSTIHVRVYEEEIETGLSTLVLVDGNMVQDQNKLVEYNAKKIKKIEVVDELYLFGSQVFEGIVSIETNEGKFKNSISDSAIKNVKLFKPQSKKIFYKQKYDDEKRSLRIPDYRMQLLWEPNLSLSKKENEITFFTSDVTGDFEVCMEGFTANGQPVSLRKIISVE